MIPPDRLINLYTPAIEGKEKRKKEFSKAGILGVEGTEKETLLTLLSPFCENAGESPKSLITKADLYAYGLSGKADSKEKRALLLKKLGLPCDMTPNAMLSAINILYSKEEFEKLMKVSEISHAIEEVMSAPQLMTRTKMTLYIFVATGACFPLRNSTALLP